MATNNTLRPVRLIPAIRQLGPTWAYIEHSPTLAVEAIFWYELGPDDKATIADIPTVKFPPVDPETIEVEALPASEWTLHQQTHYARYHWSDVL
jgi:hypothetical protein